MIRFSFLEKDEKTYIYIKRYIDVIESDLSHIENLDEIIQKEEEVEGCKNLHVTQLEKNLIKWLILVLIHAFLEMCINYLLMVE